ncbi:MAG: glycosyltransferase [Ignavibacteriaceae bacterium]|nr:glycosyltransferase [Ignavibacteriaceae bacterium]
MIKASLIISFYNNIAFLKFIIAGLERQTFKDFEIIIADDGSNQESIDRIEQISSRATFPIKHIWQEDKNFRKNKILNKAVQCSSTDYLIFIDGDCVPHPHFIQEHFQNRKEGVCFTGRRVNLSPKFTSLLSESNIRNGYFENHNLSLITDGLFGKSYDVEKGFYITWPGIRKYLNRKKRGILGSNFSIYKSDILKINGFDERYEGPSVGEDSDIQYRLELIGIKIESLKYIAIQYHLYHNYQERPQENLDLFAQIKSSGISYTPYGINKKK